MPNRWTFSINPVTELIFRYKKTGLILNPFCGKTKLNFIKSVDNDIDETLEADYHLDALDFLRGYNRNSVDMVLFDPPYSGRQVKECYTKLKRTVTMDDTNAGYLARFKNEIMRIVKPNGIVISCGWSSTGLGKKRGFEMLEVLYVNHGSSHNDTCVTVEVKR